MARAVNPQSDKPPVRYERVRRVRSFEDVVDQIRASIASGTLAVGERLPSERELAEMFGVSRPTLREALRALEAVGLVDIRLGAQGGAFAAGGGDGALTNALFGLFAAHGATRPQELLMFRATHHADNAYWAATAESSQLDHINHGAGNADALFLEALARATANPLRLIITKAIELAISEGQFDARTLDDRTRAQVAACVVAHDPETARRLLYHQLAHSAPEPPS